MTMRTTACLGFTATTENENERVVWFLQQIKCSQYMKIHAYSSADYMKPGEKAVKISWISKNQSYTDASTYINLIQAIATSKT